jgi:hypothetical protein
MCRFLGEIQTKDTPFMTSITLISTETAHSVSSRLVHGNKRSALPVRPALRKSLSAIYSVPLFKLFAFLTLSLCTCVPAIQAFDAGWNLTGVLLLGVALLLFVGGFEVAAAATGVEESF